MRRAGAALLLLFAIALLVFHVSRSRTFQLFGTIVPRVETEKKVVAITFDDGPQADTLTEVLLPLQHAGARATFFVCGAEMRQHPGIAEKLVGAGHELGNHSYSHKRMVFKTPSFIRDEVETTDALIRKAGHKGPIYFRAPYCKKLIGLPRYLAKTKRIHVTWDVEPESDKDIDASADRIAKHVVDNVRPGSIVLLHPWYRNREQTRAALPKILFELQVRGYEFVTVNELLRMKNS